MELGVVGSYQGHQLDFFFSGWGLYTFCISSSKTSKAPAVCKHQIRQFYLCPEDVLTDIGIIFGTRFYETGAEFLCQSLTLFLRDRSIHIS